MAPRPRSAVHDVSLAAAATHPDVFRLALQLLLLFASSSLTVATTEHRKSAPSTRTTAAAAVAWAYNPAARNFLYTSSHGAEEFDAQARSHGANGGNSSGSKKPKLILIGGAPGTGKSTFGMSVALDQGILKCISTDTVRAVMRSFVAEDVSPALHRSSYAEAYEGDDPVRSWKESCAVLKASVESLVDDAIERRVGLVVEGVHVVPGTKLIDKWEEAGGIAIGCLLQVSNPETHKRQLKKRGFVTGNVEKEERKINAYERVRAIQDEMMRLADESGWLRIEQRTEPDPLEMVTSRLIGVPLHSHEVFSAAKPSFTDSQQQQHVVREDMDRVSSFPYSTGGGGGGLGANSDV